jgi:maltooligosyltrehalose trehalohydrolase
VREFFTANARYWIEEFHLDGFRYDATQSVFDDTSPHILAVCNQAARKAAAAKGRQIFLAAENEPEDVRCIQSADNGGFEMDAIWNDDFHHSAHVRLTGTNPAYYSDFLGTASELTAAVKRGFVYQGQRSAWQEHARGTPTRGFPAPAFISFIQNHDQVANSARGLRGHQLTSPGRWRAMTALLLLSPGTPMLFQGQEFSASSPFLYFADFDRAKGGLGIGLTMARSLVNMHGGTVRAFSEGAGRGSELVVRNRMRISAPARIRTTRGRCSR